jgi:hypothetical protein
VDAVEVLAAKYAGDWPAWAHRKIAAMMRADGHEVSTSTVQRALRRRRRRRRRGLRGRGLQLPVAIGRIANPGRCCAGKCSGTRRPNAIGSGRPIFSEFETTGGGLWRICAVIDYATEY